MERFAAELNELISQRRPEATERLRRARELSEGDATESEGARTDQAFIEGCIQELEMLIAVSRCIEEARASERVQLGSRVTIVGLDDDNCAQTYRIVGSHEADPRRGLASNESPIGAPLLGRQIDEEVIIQAPDGGLHVRVVGVS